MKKQKHIGSQAGYRSKLHSFLAFLFAALLTVGGCTEQEKEQQELAAGQAREMTVPVEGMSCGSCVANVKQNLKPMEGVQQVSVSLEERTATLTYDPEKVTPAQVQQAINALGYKAGEPVVKENK